MVGMNAWIYEWNVYLKGKIDEWNFFQVFDSICLFAQINKILLWFFAVTKKKSLAPMEIIHIMNLFNKIPIFLELFYVYKMV